ncbi:hypothetical protein J4Q44_G00240170 [Coregonus suidteri]|uniref:E3 ubiquitin-protein ligase RNF180 C-terminal domain-containing protein n=1 Tax=Coregonus suidteri TaxID=861788 RepID=A0AAN8L512_9TELE
MVKPGEVAMLCFRRCRKGFVDRTCLHPILPDDNAAAAGTCSVWHLNVDTLPEWILWTVGKLNCENCGAHLGGFNFLNRTKCPCGQESTVHLIKSRPGPQTLPSCGLTVEDEREGPSMLEAEKQQQQGSVEPSGESLQQEDLAPGSPLLSLRMPGVSHITWEQEEVEEERWGISTELQVQPVAANAYPAPQRLSKREKNRLKSQRRKQRNEECCLHSQEQSVTGLLTDTATPVATSFVSPASARWPRTGSPTPPVPYAAPSSHTLFQKELNQSAKTFFPKVYHTRNCAKWPLPNCRKRFSIFWGYQMHVAPGRWWHFAPAGFTLDALDLTDMGVWLFDIDHVIIYIHSVNWILALLVLCFQTYFLLS